MNIGEKIKRLRLENELTQEELADRCELSKGFISQVERDMTSPSIMSLVDILESLGTNLRDFFSDESDDRIHFRAQDFFEKDNRELGYFIEWIIPNAQKNMMEPILLTLYPEGCYAHDEAHSGEEFGYVLAGSVELRFGSKEVRVRRGETFYYAANKEHSLTNKSKKNAKVILISSPPSF